MKKYWIIVVVVAVTHQAQAQGDAITKFYDKYASDESFSQVNISSKMFSLFTEMEADSPDDKEVLDAISKLKGLKIIGKDNTDNAKTLYKEAFSLIPMQEYAELMSVRDKDKTMKFLIKEKSGKISELLMIVGGDRQFMILSLFGEIDLKQVSRIGQKMNIKGLEGLEKMDSKENKKEFSK